MSFAALIAEGSGAANLGNENDDSEEEGQEAFSKLFNWCAENTEQAYNNFEELETVCTDQMMETSSNTVRSEYYYLLAWIKLEGLIAKCFYNESGDGIDYEGIEQGRKYIKLAIDIFGEDEEYCLLKYIFDLWDIDDYDEGLQVILDFEEDSINYNNALLKNEYLLSLWQENAKQYLKNQVIFNADYDDDDTDEAELWFGRIKELVRLFDFAKNDDPLSSPYYDLWEYMTDDLAARYAGGDGCVADQDEALRLANMTAENGDYMGLLWLADVYMDTEDKYVDFDRAKELLQRVLDEETEGCFYHNMAKERWAKLQADTSNGFLYSTTFTESEAEYIETLKDILSDGEISDRERRLLEKLRNKLGISTERAAELEASLTSPQLTEEEQEYLNEYREIIADGEISPRERKLLDKIRRMNGISEDRAKELEAMA